MNEPHREKMVGWYDPGQLIQTAQLVLVSTIFGRNADFRVIEAISAPDDKVHDFSRNDDKSPRDEIWIDYVADTGDGWNSTYAIAHCVAQPELKIEVRGAEKILPRAQILVFGGDEVYPTASRQEYEHRLVGPFKCALSETIEPHPQVFAIPGNHDWYDSLVSFTRLFCAKDWMAGWEAPQKRSYFALKLPHNWWLLGLDMQLESDVDEAQVKFFSENVARSFGPEDRIILCNAEPYWVYDEMYRDKDPDFREQYLHYVKFVQKYFGDRVRILLAGDLHHYRRHEATASTKSSIQQKITAGGGGAFLHPTHGPDVSTLRDGDYKLAQEGCFPPKNRSRLISFYNLLFPWFNPWFGLLPAALYFLLAWSAKPDIGKYEISDLPLPLKIAFKSVVSHPERAVWPILTMIVFWLFTDSHAKWFRRIVSTLHGLAHLAMAFALYWYAAYWFRALWEDPKDQPLYAYAIFLIVPIGGYLLGSLIMGIYLLISLNVFGRHYNEAFSSLAIQDWKSFLRIKVDASGVEIYPIGIRRVPRKWRAVEVNQDWTTMLPDDQRASDPELIEGPILVLRDDPKPREATAA